MKTTTAILSLMAITLALGACASSPSEDAAAASANATRLQSGDAEGRTSSSEIQPSVAGSYMGDAESSNVSVDGATVQRTNTSSGPLQVGWTFSATVGALQTALKEASDASPVMAALNAELARQQAADPVDPAAIAGTIAAIKAEYDSLREMLSKAGGDLSGLTSLTQVFTQVNTTGADNPLSDAQVEALASSVPGTVSAARGEQ